MKAVSVAIGIVVVLCVAKFEWRSKIRCFRWSPDDFILTLVAATFAGLLLAAVLASE